MSDSEYTPVLKPVLVKLREYMHGFYPTVIPNDGSPLHFWEMTDDELFIDTLGYLPLFMGQIAEMLDELPVGYRLAYPVFWLEDDYQFNGWCALGNAGEDLLSRAAAAYRIIGMESEAAALDAALVAVRVNPDDEDAHEKAYKSVPNVYRDDDAKLDALLTYFRKHQGLFLSANAT